MSRHSLDARRLMCPMPVIRTVMDGAAQIQEMQQQGGEGGDENPPF